MSDPSLPEGTGPTPPPPAAPPPPSPAAPPPPSPAAPPPPPPAAAPPPPPPPPVPGAYAPGYAPAYPAAAQTNGFAIAALITGIIGVVTCGYTFLVAPVLAIIFAAVAKRQIRERGEAGSGMATAGLVLGIVGVVLCLGLLAFFALAVFGSSSTTY